MRSIVLPLWVWFAGCTSLVPYGSSSDDTGTPANSAGPGLTDPPTEPTEPPRELLCVRPERGLSLCVNEVQSNNEASYQPIAPGVFPDWIELYNAGTAPIDPVAVEITVGDAEPFGIDGLPLQPGETRVLLVDGISKDGERITVTVYDLLSDSVDVPPLLDDTALARVPDGGPLQRTCEVTPGLPNGAPPACEDPFDWVFALGRVHDLRLYLDPVSWAALETSSTFAHVPAPGRLVFAGGEFPLVEVELKGGYGSFRGDLDTQKTALKLDLNVYADQAWHGLERITLNNMVQDPTFTHEYLTYALYREAGVPAPLLGYARVWVNDVPFGFFSVVQPVDDTFLDRWFDDSTGHLVEGAYGPDFDVGEEVLFEYDEGPDIAAAQALLGEVSLLLATAPWDETAYATLRTLVDMDVAMRNMAVEAATWHWDGYTTENNYYLYHDPTTNLWTMIPHGTDQTWVDGWPNAFDGNSRSVLYQFCLVVPSCLLSYDQAVLDTADALDRAALEPVLDALIALTEPEFALETRAEETGDRAGQLVTTRARIQTAAQALRDAAAVH